MTTTNYDQQAIDLAKKHNIKLKVIDVNYEKMNWDKKGDKRWVFKLRLERNRKTYTFKFGQSQALGNEEPTMYDVLACIQKYDVGTFEDFCGNFGYDDDSRTAEKTYNAVVKEYDAVERLFSDILEELQEIQ